MLAQAHVRDFKRLALDASCLIHRGGRASAADFLHSRKSSSKWLGYPLRIVDAILSAGVTPVVVFDGASLPMKARTDAVRAAQREAHHRTAAALLQGWRALALGPTYVGEKRLGELKKSPAPTLATFDAVGALL